MNDSSEREKKRLDEVAEQHSAAMKPQLDAMKRQHKMFEDISALIKGVNYLIQEVDRLHARLDLISDEKQASELSEKADKLDKEIDDGQ